MHGESGRDQARLPLLGEGIPSRPAPRQAKVEAKFKDISAAYHLLSDPNRRAKYDRGEIDASGAERPERTFYRHFADHDGGGAFFDQLSTIFGDSFMGAKMSRGPPFRMRGAEVALAMQVGFIEAATGARKRIPWPARRSRSTFPPASETVRPFASRARGMRDWAAGHPAML